MDASLRYAPFSMTRQCHSERSEESSAMRILHFVERDNCAVIPNPSFLVIPSVVMKPSYMFHFVNTTSKQDEQG